MFLETAMLIIYEVHNAAERVRRTQCKQGTHTGVCEPGTHFQSPCLTYGEPLPTAKHSAGGLPGPR